MSRRARVQTNVHTRVRTYTHKHKHKQTRTCAFEHIRIRTRTRAHAYVSVTPRNQSFHWMTSQSAKWRNSSSFCLGNPRNNEIVSQFANWLQWNRGMTRQFSTVNWLQSNRGMTRQSARITWFVFLFFGIFAVLNFRGNFVWKTQDIPSRLTFCVILLTVGVNSLI